MPPSQFETAKLSLQSLPQAIEQNAVRLAAMDREYTEAKQAIAVLELQVLSSVVFDATLKNDDQRKVRKAETLEAHQGYQEAVTSLLELTQKRAECAALLERLRSELSIAKLEVKLAIARLGSADTDLLGV